MYGDRTGRHQFIVENNIDVLNDNVRSHPGLVEKEVDLIQKIKTVVASDHGKMNLHLQPPSVSKSTALVYNFRASREVNGVSAIHIKSAVDKNKRRQRAISSERNCMAQICMLLTSLIEPDPLSFKPGHERYKCNLSEGAKLSIDLMEGMFKVPIKAVSPTLTSINFMLKKE